MIECFLRAIDNAYSLDPRNRSIDFTVYRQKEILIDEICMHIYDR